MELELRTVKPDDAETATAIEAACFPESEACTLPIMKERIALASDCFLVALEKKSQKMIGFINGLCTNELTLRDELFTDTGLHDPAGVNIMICSVAVLPEYRYQGVARNMMKEFLKRQAESGRTQAILTCVPEKVGMYAKFGFLDRGDSESAWGGEKWHEMYCYISSICS